MATYSDALSAAAINGVAPDINAVRNDDRTKTGFGINMEHKIREDIHVFGRAMRADGKTETYAFAEVHRSVSAGFSFKGDSWQRASDTTGIALAANFLSQLHRTYLERGGLTFFLGDGALRYGAERIFEAYYSVALRKSLRLTADYQRTRTPATARTEVRCPSMLCVSISNIDQRS